MGPIRLSLAIGVLASVPAAGQAQQPLSTMRSVGDTRQRPADEHDRPYFRETQSHRGFEVRAPQYTVVADTSREDARLAAAHVEQAWRAASDLARHWTSAVSEPDFALNALQVVISSEPPRDQDQPTATVNVVGIQTQVQLHVGPGQPALAQQVMRLREGAAFAMLHTAEVDAVAPQWVVSGLASFAARSGLAGENSPPDRSRRSENQLPALGPQAPDAALPNFGGQQWRFERSEPDRLAYPPADHELAAAKIAFCLTAQDARHAPKLFQLLGDAQTRGQQNAARFGAFGPVDSHQETAFDRFLADHDAEYQAWQANPQAGQPVFEPDRDAPESIAAAQREMVTLLKLLARQPLEAGSPKRAAKIIELDREGRPASRHVTGESQPASFSHFAASLVDPARPAWATLDADGNLLLSTDRQRVIELLSPQGARYELASSGGRTVLVRAAERGPTIRGWLQPNPDDQQRPIARFELAGGTRNVRVHEYKPPERR